MTFDEFNLQIERLKSAWPNAYSTERVKLFWALLKEADAIDFKNQVSRWLVEARHSPLGPEFQDFGRTQNKIRDLIPEDNCRSCLGDGRKMMIRNSDKSLWVFMCNVCEGAVKNGYHKYYSKADGQTSYWKYWNDSIRSEYESV